METKTYTVYKFNELTESAKQKAIDNYRNHDEYFWAGENEHTLKEFCNIFPVKVREFDYGYNKNIDFTYTADDNILQLKGLRLATYIHNNYGYKIFKKKYLAHIHKEARYSKIQKETDCVLTGYYIDNEILDPIYQFLKSPKENVTFEDLLNDCLQSWLSACQKDYEATQEDEYIIEHLEANDYDFTIDGKID